MRKKSHLWETTLLLLILASGCAEKKRESVQHPLNEKHKSDPTLEADKPPQMGGEAESVTAKVVSIKDGDTIVVVRNQEQITVRLAGIDCPETGQAFGTKAKQTASDLCFGKKVTLKETGKDRYGRTLAHVILPDGSELNRQLVRQGFAWWYRKYSADLIHQTRFLKCVPCDEWCGDRNVSTTLRQLPSAISVESDQLVDILAVRWGPAPRPPGFLAA